MNSTSNDQEILDHTTQSGTDDDMVLSITLPSGRKLTSDPAPRKASTIIGWCNAVRNALAADEEPVRAVPEVIEHAPAASIAEDYEGASPPAVLVEHQLTMSRARYGRAKEDAERAVGEAKAAKEEYEQWQTVAAALGVPEVHYDTGS